MATDAIRGRGYVTDENAVLAAAIVCVSLPASLALVWLFDATVRVVVLVTLTVSLLPPWVYRKFWPRRYDPRQAFGWGIAAAGLAFAEIAVLLFAFWAPLSMNEAIVAATVVLVAVDYAAARVWRDRNGPS
jgi:uncharacterized membrane protein